MKWIFKFSLMMLIQVSAFGQTPEKISYQAVIRDNNGVLIENSKVNLKIVLKQGSSNGATVYEELHNIMTNKNGLLSLEIGSGQISKGYFDEIDWAKGPFFIETHVDPKGSSNYKLNGISQLLSVPYALHAKSADSFTGTISPAQLPDFYTADEIDNIFLNMVTERTPVSSFSGDYRDLENQPRLFSGRYSDLEDKPELYNKGEIDNLIQGIETTGRSPQNLNLEGETLNISGGNSISFVNWDTNAADDFSGSYDDLQNKPILFSGQYSDLQNKPELYSKTEIDNLIQGIETTGVSQQNLNLEGETLSISDGNSISFENWDTNAADDFSGRYNDLQDKPELYSKTEIDNLIQGIETTGVSQQNLNLEGGTLSISGGNSISFENWDTNAADDFSGRYNDLQDKPELYSKTEIDNLIQGIETTGVSQQNLNLEGRTLSFSGGNSISFENWDTNAADDFSGSYDDLQNKPSLFSGQYSDLQNKPELYSKTEIDNLIQGIETTGVSQQNLNLEGETLSISGGNSISFENWDTNAADDFSGRYNDLQDKPELYNKLEIDNLIQGIETTGGSPQNLNIEGETLSISGGNSISFENWDTNAADDFSGSYDDLQNKPSLFSGQYADIQNKPELYNKSEIDNLIQGIETTGVSQQNLNLEGGTLSISGGNSISFENWDTNAADDFSGSYDDLQNKPILFSGQYADIQNKPVLFSGVYTDLQNKPELYTKTEIDNLIQGIETTGVSQLSLNLEGNTLTISGGNSISFENWDTNAADDFSGSYDDLQNKPILFSGHYADIQNKPELYNKSEIDNLIQGIETTGVSQQNLNLEGETLSISGGNSISFENWDTNAADDFSGSYDDLQNKPFLFSGQYADIQNKPELYSKTEIDNLLQGIETTGVSQQNLNLDGSTLSISGGNSISFLNWDTNAADDFSGVYDDLQNKPVLFSGQYTDLQNKPELYNKAEIDNLLQSIETTGGSPQNLNLEGATLSISEGNSISFENWDTNAADDFDGEYSSLTGAPKVYTQEEVDAIKAEILVHVKENYSPKARVVSLSSSRNVLSTDVGNTLACVTSATLTITSAFSGMQVGDIINLEVHGTTLTVKGGTGVVINGTSGGSKSIGNNVVYTGGLIRKIATNSYIIL